MLRSALFALRAAVDGLLVGQEPAKTGCLLALLARQHVYLDGPPGCGKSALAEGLAAVSGAVAWTLAVHRETRAWELLGASVLVRERAAGGERIRLAHGRAPLVNVALLVLDDLPRAPGEALLPLLRALSERRIAGAPIPLECAVATGSSPPPGGTGEPLESAALDRFAVQIRMRGLVASGRFSEVRSVLDATPNPPSAAIDTKLRHQLQDGGARIHIPGSVREALVDLVGRLAALRGPDGPGLFSDRSMVSCALPLIRAHALLRGAARVAMADLAAVRFMLGCRVPETLLALAEELVEDAAREVSPVRSAIRPPSSAGEGAAHTQALDSRLGAVEPAPLSPPPPQAARAEWAAAADVVALLRTLEGRIEPGRVDRGSDPGGSPRRQARLVRLDELEDADEIEALLFVDGLLPGGPRVLRRERRRAAGALAVLRDVSASMEGGLGRAASQVVAGLVRLGARRRMRIGYVEFHHEAEPFDAAGAFFHRRYGRLLALAARERAEGRTSFEAPLRAALSAFGAAGGGDRHIVLVTDGMPVVGDPGVVRERALARRLGVRVHTVFLGSGEPPAVLERLARDTGGQAFVLDAARTQPLRVRERGAA